MTQKDENYLTMATVTLLILKVNEPIWTEQAVFSRIVGEIDEDVKAINTAIKHSGLKSLEATVTKYQAADSAISRAVKYSGLAQIYALEIGDMRLFDALKTSASKLEKLPDQQLVPELERIYSRVDALKEELRPYDVSKSDLDKFQKHIDNFKQHKDLPRVVITERKSYNSSIPTLLIGLRESFFKLDRLIKIWEHTNGKFIADYENARIVIRLGTRHKKGEAILPQV
jgi:hypothetical protein